MASTSSSPSYSDQLPSSNQPSRAPHSPALQRSLDLYPHRNWTPGTWSNSRCDSRSSVPAATPPTALPQPPPTAYPHPFDRTFSSEPVRVASVPAQRTPYNPYDPAVATQIFRIPTAPPTLKFASEQGPAALTVGGIARAATNRTRRGRRFALLIGIRYDSQRTLHGSQTDVVGLYNLLSSFGYEDRYIRVLTDAPTRQIPPSVSVRAPTFSNIVLAVEHLVTQASADDTLFVSYSGHGSLTTDSDDDDDEPPHQHIYPVDWKTVGPMRDDVLSRWLVDRLPVGANLTACIDCCHSASILALPWTYDPSTRRWNPTCPALPQQTPRRLDRWQNRIRQSLSGRASRGQTFHDPQPDTGSVVLFAACGDTEKSMEGVSHAANKGIPTGGILTNAFIRAVQELRPEAASYHMLLTRVRFHVDCLWRRGIHAQTAQMTTNYDTFDATDPFFL